MSKRKAEMTYGVPRKTITRHLKKEVLRVGKLGRYDCTLSSDLENALCQHIVTMQRMMFGFTTVDVRKLAYDLAVQNNVLHPFNDQKKMAGKDWLAGFLSRHQQISIRNPEPTSMSRATAFNEPNKNRFFEIYKHELQKEQFTASRIWNVDESGFTAVHAPRKILAERGIKQVGKITSAEKGVTTTAVCAFSASGNYIPPMLIFKRKRMTELLLRGSPPGTLGACSDNGWITNELFLKWLKHFAAHAKPSNDEKVILLLDGHGSHKTLQAVEYARAHGIVMISFPPHSTHHMQPLDRTFFGPLKVQYHKECDKWMTQHVGQRISPFQLAELFGLAYAAVANIAKAQSGFSCTGMWPYNPDVYTAADFAPSMITDEPEPERTTAASQTSPSTVSVSEQPGGAALEQPGGAVLEQPSASVLDQAAGSVYITTLGYNEFTKHKLLFLIEYTCTYCGQKICS